MLTRFLTVALLLLLVVLQVLQVLAVVHGTDGNNSNSNNTESSSSSHTATTTTTMSSSNNNNNSNVLSSELEQELRKEFNNSNGVYNATDDEIIRFSQSVLLKTYGNKSKRSNNTKDMLKVKKLATERLEEYFDWRQSYGLDYQNDKNGNELDDIDDASIWKWAVERATRQEELQQVKQKHHHQNDADTDNSSPTSSSVVGGWFGFGFGKTITIPQETETNNDGKIIVDGVKNSPGTVDYDAAITKATNNNDGDSQNDDDAGNDETYSDKKEESEKEKKDGGKGTPPPILPQIIFQHSDPTKNKSGGGDGDGANDDIFLRDLNGVPILHVFAAKIDRHAGSAETWALAVSLYLERLFDRSPSSVTLQRMNKSNDQATGEVNDGTCPVNNDGSDTKRQTTKQRKREIGNVTLLVDLRGGEHWPNPKAIMMINLIRKIVHSIATYHPGRITSMIMYPLPRALLGVWNSVSGYFGPDVVESFHLVSGPSKPGSPLPKLELQQFIDGNVLDWTEQRRNELDVA